MHKLELDCAEETRRIEEFLRHGVARTLNRRGAVLGVSGGVDSAVCAALAARALGPTRVMALLMPEIESSPDSRKRGEQLCQQLGIAYTVEDITPGLAAVRSYTRRDEAIRQLFPDYGPGWRSKIALAGNLGDGSGNGGGITWFNLVVQSPEGEMMTRRMPVQVYNQVVAANNWKQRLRKGFEYYHAERLNYAVIGTPNRLEYALGFFVRGGDGLADIKPIAHLYKTQVYALAEYLDIPEAIRSQPPSTDTYSLPQTQEEFYFTLPFSDADQLLHAIDSGGDPLALGDAIGLSQAQVAQLCRDFAGKRRQAERTLRNAIILEDAT